MRGADKRRGARQRKGGDEEGRVFLERVAARAQARAKEEGRHYGGVLYDPDSGRSRATQYNTNCTHML